MISSGAASVELKDLKRDCLVDRWVLSSENPPGMEYALTPLVRTLSAPSDTIVAWALEHREETEEALRRAVRATFLPS